MTPAELFDQLVKAAPGFEAVRAEHIRVNEELLPHVLLGELLGFVAQAFSPTSAADASAPTMEEVRSILGVLDLALGEKHPLTENAIAVSFVEGIETEAFFLSLEPLLGPELRAELARQKDWWNAH